MFTTISWIAFFRLILISLLIYYIAIGILYYRQEIYSMINRINRTRNKSISDDTSVSTEQNK